MHIMGGSAKKPKTPPPAPAPVRVEPEPEAEAQKRAKMRNGLADTIMAQGAGMGMRSDALAQKAILGSPMGGTAYGGEQ